MALHGAATNGALGGRCPQQAVTSCWSSSLHGLDSFRWQRRVVGHRPSRSVSALQRADPTRAPAASMKLTGTDSSDVGANRRSLATSGDGTTKSRGERWGGDVVRQWIPTPRARLWAARRAGWAHLAIGSILIGVCCYGVGLYSGTVLLLRDASKVCGVDRLLARADSKQLSSLTQTFFPLRNICRYTDGTSVDLVPPYINPAVFAFAALAAVSAALELVAVVAPGRSREHERKDGSGTR